MEMLDVGVCRCGSGLGVGVEAEGSWELVSQCPVQMANLRSSETPCDWAIEEDDLWTLCTCLQWGTQASGSKTLVT